MLALSAETLDSSTGTLSGLSLAEARAKNKSNQRVLRATRSLETQRALYADSTIFGRQYSDSNKGGLSGFLEESLFGLNAMMNFGFFNRTDEIDLNSENFLIMKKYAEDRLGLDFSDFDREDFTREFSNVP